MPVLRGASALQPGAVDVLEEPDVGAGVLAGRPERRAGAEALHEVLRLGLVRAGPAGFGERPRDGVLDAAVAELAGCAALVAAVELHLGHRVPQQQRRRPGMDPAPLE